MIKAFIVAMICTVSPQGTHQGVDPKSCFKYRIWQSEKTLTSEECVPVMDFLRKKIDGSKKFKMASAVCFSAKDSHKKITPAKTDIGA